jgi:hypothetical protein
VACCQEDKAEATTIHSQSRRPERTKLETMMHRKDMKPFFRHLPKPLLITTVLILFPVSLAMDIMESSIEWFKDYKKLIYDLIFDLKD